METKDKISRLSVTEKALEVIWELEKKHGELMFYQAGGCCEGTQPQCFEKGGYFPRMNDAMIGTIPDEDARYRAKVDWDGSAAIESDSPTMLMLAAGLGLSEADLELLFGYAQAL